MKKMFLLTVIHVTNHLDGTSEIHLSSKTEKDDNTDGHTHIWFTVHKDDAHKYVPGQTVHVDINTENPATSNDVDKAIPSE